MQALHQRCTSMRIQATTRHSLFFGTRIPTRKCVVRSDGSDGSSTSEQPSTSNTTNVDLDKELMKFTRQTAATFAPRSSTAQKNPAVKGSLLYDIFEYQAWICLLAGGLLSFNLIWPTDEPSIARLLGMWSIWMFTIPSLRAKECTVKEKDALNVLFLLVPLMNVALPFMWKSFPFIFSSNVLALGLVYWWKGVWKEVYGLPLEWAGAAAAAGGEAAGSGNGEGEGDSGSSSA